MPKNRKTVKVKPVRVEAYAAIRKGGDWPALSSIDTTKERVRLWLLRNLTESELKDFRIIPVLITPLPRKCRRPAP